MAAIATLAWPRILTASALLGLTLLGGHDGPRGEPATVRMEAFAPPTIPPLGKTIVPGPFADAREWPRGMVIAPPATGDRMATGVPGPVVALLSGLFELLGSRGA